MKRWLFQAHWLAGITAGLVLAVVGITGAMLSFQDELTRWMNPALYPARGGGRLLTPAELVERIEGRVTAITLHRDGSAPARITLAPREVRYADPYTGQALGEPRATAFFRFVMQVHRWLAAGDAGRHVVGASTIALLALCLSGLYLRWPRRARDWRAWLALDRRRRGRGFLLHLHAVLGTWVLLAYLLMGLTGLYWSYDWYRSALFSLSGTKPPAPQRGEKGQAALDVAWAAFERAAPDYTSATVRPGARVQISYLTARAAHERAFDRMVLDAKGALLTHERYADKPAGAKLMASIFALHSGKFFGLPGVVALLLASLALPVFFVTGWMMYLSRRRVRVRAQTAASVA